MTIMKTATISLLFVLTYSFSYGQTIEEKRGYSPHIGVIVSMLDDLKQRITRSVSDLDQEGTDFLLDSNANRIGSLIMHLAATEKYYQLYTFEGRGFNEDEEMWERALSLGETAREEFTGKPISYYLEIWTEVREETLRLLKKRDDKWFKEKVNGTNMNNHWAWYHVMEHQANHMGQIRLIKKRYE